MDISSLQTQLRSLVDTVDAAQQKKLELEQQIEKLHIESKKKQAEFEEQQSRIQRLQCTVPHDGDKILVLDVGGRVFKTYRATLTQFDGSVLAALASSHWTDSCRESGGHVFLDIDPDAFEEVLGYLRIRRLEPDAEALFTPKAGTLAHYFGIPVDRIKDEICLKMTADRAGNKCSHHGFIFDMFMPGRWICAVRSISFHISNGGLLTIYTKRGSFQQQTTEREGWEEVWSSQVAPGYNRLEFAFPAKLTLLPGGTQAVYLACSGDTNMDLKVSDSHRIASYVSMASACQLSEGMKLVCKAGRPMAKIPFTGVESEVGNVPRYFAGEIEYALQ